jgi:hypothetical protein
MSAPLTLYLAESGLNWLKLVVLMEEVCLMSRFLSATETLFSLACLTSKIPQPT